jgi:hypothetical protein
MPSSKNYRRNYSQEYKTAKARGEEDAGHNGVAAIRHRDRRLATKLGMVKPGDRKDLDHAHPLSKGGKEGRTNWRVESPHDNRSFPRRSDGSMIANHPKTRK